MKYLVAASLLSTLTILAQDRVYFATSEDLLAFDNMLGSKLATVLPPPSAPAPASVTREISSIAEKTSGSKSKKTRTPSSSVKSERAKQEKSQRRNPQQKLKSKSNSNGKNKKHHK